MRVDGRTLYTLVDTPGFQRARRVLRWLEEAASDSRASAADRPALVRRFVDAPGHAERFPDEVELLRPIVEGAAILYVVDGSVPYGREYEPEMQVLRWTGAPSMAIINPISSTAHVDAWRSALGQYFRIVRVVDAVRSEFDERQELLRAFGQLDERFREPLAQAVARLQEERDERRRRAARIIADLLAEAIQHTEEQRLEEHEVADDHEDGLRERYEGALRKLERRARADVEGIYDHREVVAHESDLELLERDLFSEDTWLVFGLRRRDLLTLGALGGAGVGGAIAVALGGASLLAGAALGAAAGAALGWIGADRLAQAQVVNQPLGGRLLRYGPSKNPNLPFVLLGRARLHHQTIERRTHAERTAIQLDAAAGERLELDAGTRNRVARCFDRLRRDDAEARRELRSAIEGLL